MLICFDPTYCVGAAQAPHEEGGLRLAARAHPTAPAESRAGPGAASAPGIGNLPEDHPGRESGSAQPWSGWQCWVGPDGAKGVKWCPGLWGSPRRAVQEEQGLWVPSGA